MKAGQSLQHQCNKTINDKNAIILPIAMYFPYFVIMYPTYGFQRPYLASR